MSEPVAWYVRHSADEPPMLFTDEERAKKAAFSCGCGAKPLYLSQVSHQENSTPEPPGEDFRIPPSNDPVHRMCDKALTQLGQYWMNKIDAAWGVTTLTDAERGAIKEASEFYIGTRTGVALRGLLERLGGEQ